MLNLVELFKTHSDIFDHESIVRSLVNNESSMAKIIQTGLELRIPFDGLSSAYNYWVGITTGKLSANLIQAQRDYFGAHTYQRTDAPEDQYFHTNWKDT